ncbi:MAG: peptide-methionine (R)-S-oxide reductase MsrB [Planctomycetota bacterium]
MKSQLLFVAVLLLTAGLFVYWTTVGQARAAEPGTQLPAPQTDLQPADGLQTAVFAGGCFWCVEAYFEPLRGVAEAVSGYAGGSAEDAVYDEVAAGRTEHVEVVQVTYDPAKISYADLLHVFFTLHDPMEGDGQRPDYGPHYRPAVFYADEEQKRVAGAYIEQLNAANVFDGPIQTGLEKLDTFYPAEAYHQDFVERNPNHPYVVRWALPKVAKVNKAFGHLIGEPVSRVEKSDAQWRELLTPEEFYILREDGTERPFTSPLNNEKRAGTFVCAGCALPLFSSEAKYDSGTGWPSFYQPIAAHHVREVDDYKLGMRRVEIECASCGGHQGHVFTDGPQPTGLRYCINGIALDFIPDS